MKSRPSRVFEALIGLALSAFVLWSYYLSNFVFKDPAYFEGPGLFSWLESLELKLYDARSKFRTSIDAGGKEIVLIVIDDDSLARLGRWPWPRTRIAQMVDLLTAAKPRLLGIDIVYSEPEDVPGIEEIKNLQAKYQELTKSRKITQRGAKFSSEFDDALARMNFDAALQNSFAKAGNVILPMMFTGGGLRGAKPDPMPPGIEGSSLTVRSTGAGLDLGHTNMEGVKAVVPLPIFTQSIQGVGHANIYPDFDGAVRREYPVVKYGEKFYPSFALELVMRYLGFAPKDVIVRPGQSIQMGRNTIPLDHNQSMMISFNGPYQTFHNYSFYDVLNGKVSMDVFKDKLVLLGPTATAISTLYVTPVAANLPAPELVANIIENMLHLRFLIRPDWAAQAELVAIGVSAAFLMFVLPFLSAFWGAFVTLVLIACVSGAGVYYFIHGLWLKVAYSGFLLALGYVLITTKRFFTTEKGKERVEASAIETNKMLGLSFQGQGQLDLAFEKFRLCPVDDHLKELLYNLGLDFERKRQYNKAAAVYEHIANEDSKYKDITQKIKILKQASEGVVFGNVGGKGKEGTLLVGTGGAKPTLGRYEVEKEIGRGAMGIVYLGNDPKINRKVAIKTMVLEEGMEAAALKETKERFFREAESAGTLNHPNIVRIFDAGEEHDVSYIAMELLDGHDLTRYTSKDSLLAPEVVMEYMAKVADALDYAHTQGIIHRDIKPANVMLIKDGSIRVTDFGIARITASSKTATGTVVGTPAYMSPEQVSGKKVDGRSDIFSLGVVFFELLLGEKPFKAGDGGLGTLLFSISNDQEPEPAVINPKLPPCAAQIIHRALKKESNQRYQRASEMAAGLRACIKALKDGTGTIPEPAPTLASPPSAGAAISPTVTTTVPTPVVSRPAQVVIPSIETGPVKNFDPSGTLQIPVPVTPEPITETRLAPTPLSPNSAAVDEQSTADMTIPFGSAVPAPQAPPAAAPPAVSLDRTEIHSIDEIAAAIGGMGTIDAPQSEPATPPPSQGTPGKDEPQP